MPKNSISRHVISNDKYLKILEKTLIKNSKGEEKQIISHHPPKTEEFVAKETCFARNVKNRSSERKKIISEIWIYVKKMEKLLK